MSRDALRTAAWAILLLVCLLAPYVVVADDGLPPGVQRRDFSIACSEERGLCIIAERDLNGIAAAAEAIAADLERTKVELAATREAMAKLAKSKGCARLDVLPPQRSRLKL